jgi:hypothetical protein
MKLVIFTYLLICLLNSSLFGQTETAKKEAYKVATAGVTYYSDINNSLQNLRDSNPNDVSFAFVIYKGIGDSPKVHTRQLKNLQMCFDFLPIDRKRVTVIEGGYQVSYMNEFWVVPEGAENPKPTDYAEKFTSFRTAKNGFVSTTLQNFLKKVSEKENSVGYIVNFGTKKQKAVRIKQLNKAFDFMGIGRARIVFVNGSYSKTLKTEFWIMPPKSEK